MKNILLCLLVATTPAFARLGENPTELVARYGQPLSEADQKRMGEKIALANVSFQKGGFQIDVVITNGLSVQEHYHKLNGQPINEDEVAALMTANAEGRTWLQPKVINGSRVWTRDDGATATFEGDGSLTVRLPALNAEEAKAKHLEQKPSVEGF
jgi:hypothetical protein